MEVLGDVPVRIPVGGSRQVVVKTRKNILLQQLRLELNDPPKGLSLHDVSVVAQGLQFRLKADKDAVKSGFADNLIVEAFREFTPKGKDGKPRPKRRWPVGYLPAVPIQIVQ